MIGDFPNLGDRVKILRGWRGGVTGIVKRVDESSAVPILVRATDGVNGWFEPVELEILPKVSETKHTLAALSILNAFEASRGPREYSAYLRGAGVAKGTASKVETVLKALYAEKITPEQVTSLNAAYTFITAAAKRTVELKEFRDALAKTETWRESDSNDGEMAALRYALDIAVELLGAG